MNLIIQKKDVKKKKERKKKKSVFLKLLLNQNSLVSRTFLKSVYIVHTRAQLELFLPTCC